MCNFPEDLQVYTPETFVHAYFGHLKAGRARFLSKLL